MYKLGWFSTGRGPGSRGLLTAVYHGIKSGEVKAEIAFVFCSREPGEAEGSDEFLSLVKSYGIPLAYFSYQRFRKERALRGVYKEGALPSWRLEYDREIMARLAGFHPDLCVLAGYMLMVGKEMCQKYNMLNLHPAAPAGPKGTWQDVIWQLIGSQAHETGVMMHLATPELDRGPVVSYCIFPIRGEKFDRYWREIEGHSPDEIKRAEGEENTLFKQIRAEGVAREIPLIIATIKAFSEGRVKIVDYKVVDAFGKLVEGYDLTGEIEEKVVGK